MNNSHPEVLLHQILAVDRVLLGSDVVKEMDNFIEHGECGLAYDVLIFVLQDGTYHPSREGLALVELLAKSLGVVFPRLSTE